MIRHDWFFEDMEPPKDNRPEDMKARYGPIPDGAPWWVYEGHLSDPGKETPKKEAPKKGVPKSEVAAIGERSYCMLFSARRGPDVTDAMLADGTGFLEEYLEGVFLLETTAFEHMQTLVDKGLEHNMILLKIHSKDGRVSNPVGFVYNAHQGQMYQVDTRGDNGGQPSS